MPLTPTTPTETPGAGRGVGGGLTESLFKDVVDERKKRFLQAYCITGSITESSIEAKIGLATPFNWRKNEEFEKLFERARMIFLNYDKDVLEKIALERIKDPKAPMSSVLLMHRLKARDPAYRDTAPAVQVGGDVTIKVEFPNRFNQVVESEAKEITD